MLNGNKRGVTPNLKSVRGKEIFLKLISQADVVLENFAPGAMDKLGIGSSVLSALNDRLIYASGSGYRHVRRRCQQSCDGRHDQAASGLMSMTGFPDSPPIKADPALADFLSGIHLYTGVVTALYERSFTGRGCMVESPCRRRSIRHWPRISV